MTITASHQGVLSAYGNSETKELFAVIRWMGTEETLAELNIAGAFRELLHEENKPT